MSPPPIIQTTQATSVRPLTELAKMYQDDMKFSGDRYDVFGLKLKIFMEHCTKSGVTEEQYALAYGTILGGKARSYYYEHLMGHSFTFTEMVERTKGYFHTPENRQLFLNEWRSIMLKDFIAKHPEKGLDECLEIVIDKLQKIHQGLTQNFGSNDTNLASQLTSACQGVEACLTVINRPASTFEAVASELRSAVGNWIRCRPSNQSIYNHVTAVIDWFPHLRRINSVIHILVAVYKAGLAGDNSWNTIFFGQSIEKFN